MDLEKLGQWSFSVVKLRNGRMSSRYSPGSEMALMPFSPPPHSCSLHKSRDMMPAIRPGNSGMSRLLCSSKLRMIPMPSSTQNERSQALCSPDSLILSVLTSRRLPSVLSKDISRQLETQEESSLCSPDSLEISVPHDFSLLSSPPQFLLTLSSSFRAISILNKL